MRLIPLNPADLPGHQEGPADHVRATASASGRWGIRFTLLSGGGEVRDIVRALAWYGFYRDCYQQITSEVA